MRCTAPRSFAALLLALLVPGCMTVEYDLAGISVPVSAKPADPSATEVEPFRLEARHTLWVHGLFGRRSPDVDAMVAEVADGYDRIADFRVRQEANVHHWLLTHLSLTLVRMKRVVVEGQLVRD